MLSDNFFLIWVNTYKNNIFLTEFIINNVQQFKKNNATDCIEQSVTIKTFLEILDNLGTLEILDDQEG